MVTWAFEKWNAGQRCFLLPIATLIYYSAVRNDSRALSGMCPELVPMLKGIGHVGCNCCKTCISSFSIGLFVCVFVCLFVSYRGSTGEDLQREKESEADIKQALEQSKRAMRFGDTYGAVSALESVKQVTTVTVETSGQDQDQHTSAVLSAPPVVLVYYWLGMPRCIMHRQAGIYRWHLIAAGITPST